MEKISEFIAILSDKNIQQRTADAKTNRLCKICGREAGNFLDAKSEFEYQISAICEECQNYYLGQ
jgi:superfamily II helicase